MAGPGEYGDPGAIKGGVLSHHRVGHGDKRVSTIKVLQKWRNISRTSARAWDPQTWVGEGCRRAGGCRSGG